MTTATHRVLTHRQARNPLRLLFAFLTSLGASNLLVFLVVSSVVSGLALGVAVATIDSNGLIALTAFAGLLLGAFVGYFVTLALPDDERWDNPLAPLSVSELDDLRKLAMTVPPVQAWVQPAIAAGLTFRTRDLDAAREARKRWASEIERREAEERLALDTRANEALVAKLIAKSTRSPDAAE